MNLHLAYPLKELPLVFLVLAIAFSVHEFAHAFVAYKFGDPTAQKLGRLTLSPLKHLDPIGTIAILLFGFGWARPVPVNRYNFKNPRLAGILTTIAGPISNFLLALIGVILWNILIKVSLDTSMSSALFQTLFDFCQYFVSINVVLFVFNLIPLPPLDGYRVIEDLVPNDLRAKMSQYEAYGSVIFLILVLTPLDRYTIQPIFNVAVPTVLHFISSIVSPFFT
ncbi:site-2 protease family protein [Bacillus sp. RG28]|uniref:Site-2 protease family protein n=1 Tax=Gottfriedia endophytica TaxID=2820819 RepID=A0A940NUD2_9BACI|nr:site-2 protease family protein [Gottfriedia endophytica]MBP0725008.1 site-2 protease family protein [Gottfriedia endophytica]